MYKYMSQHNYWYNRYNLDDDVMHNNEALQLLILLVPVTVLLTLYL